MVLESTKKLDVFGSGWDESDRELEPGDPSDLPETQSESDFKLKFAGKPNEVNASTLGYSLVNITTIIREISSEVATAQTIEIKVKAVEPGSFLIHLGLNAVHDPIFEASLVQVASIAPTILKTFTEIFKLRKLLKGEPPKETVKKDDEIHITAGDDARITIDKSTYNIYFNHPNVNEAMGNTFKALESDPKVEGFEIIDAHDKALFEVERDDFEGMALTTSVPQGEERNAVEQPRVYVVKPSFDPKLKWDVLYKGIRITASMKDEEFQGRIDRGERFAKGDILVIDLKIHQKLDRDLGTYVNKTYEIIRVRQHIPRPTQGNLLTEGQHTRKVVWDDEEV